MRRAARLVHRFFQLNNSIIEHQLHRLGRQALPRRILRAQSHRKLLRAGQVRLDWA